MLIGVKGVNQKVRVLEVGCLTKKVTGMTQAKRSAAKKVISRVHIL